MNIEVLIFCNINQSFQKHFHGYYIIGLIANTAAILGNALGSRIIEVVIKDIFYKNNNMHLGIIEIPITILRKRKFIIQFERKLYEENYKYILTTDFSNLAKGCKTYEEFIQKIPNTEYNELKYYGILLFGYKKKINKLSGNLGLLI